LVKKEMPKTAKKEMPKTAKSKKEEIPKKQSDNVVLVGVKPAMNYVIACLTFFNSGEKEVVVKARGRAISRAVDTIELLRRAFVKDLRLKKIEIGTEEIVRNEGKKSNVSTIEIAITKTKSK
jgi:DNA-binding protein